MVRRCNAGFVLLVALALGSASTGGGEQPEREGDLEAGAFIFEGSQAEAEKFIAYYDSIQLTAEQEEIRLAALREVPAPCCSTFSAATCCCECNLSRTIWGLAKFLIAREGRSAGEVRLAVAAWVDAVNSSGYPGDTCFKGGCGRSFREGGCGGMRVDQLIVE
jgi:hypothetical protein